MNLADLHHSDKEISTFKLNKKEIQSVIAIQVEKGRTLTKHITKTPAILLCVAGNVIYETESKQKEILRNGDYVFIQENVMHWLYGNENSQLILMK